ncbi:hypothetical protein ACLI1A_08585 [Flavobacterium sp. RHBU_3]|uniref:hypothetical protein n=1 Tax=Flavobacterium sp. RHBU_3 TaxID=3391184 RepID=UPI003984E7CA
MEYKISKSASLLHDKLVDNEFISVDDFDLDLLQSYDEGQLDIDYAHNKFINYYGYKFEESFKDVININKLYFHGIIEVDLYFSKLEICIENIGVGLSLLNYDEGLWYDDQPEEEKALWKTFRSFDTRPEIGDGKMAVFSIQEGVSPPNEPAIYYIDRAFYCKTNLTFVQYYEAVLDMMGIADWQLLFSEVSLKDPMISYKYDGLKASLEALAKAFPDKDYSKYFELLEARWV